MILHYRVKWVYTELITGVRHPEGTESVASRIGPREGGSGEARSWRSGGAVLQPAPPPKIIQPKGTHMDIREIRVDTAGEIADDILGLRAAHEGSDEFYVEMYANHPLADLDEDTLVRIENWARAFYAE
jgi:hypothetical protein